MRSSYILFLPLALSAATLLPSSTAHAQQAAAPMPAAPVAATPAPLPEMAVLAIPAPPGAKLRFEMDARSEDLLGLVKSFLKGIGDSKSTDQSKATIALSSAPVTPANPIEEALENGNLADILKDVNHFHFAVWELPPPLAVPAPAKAQAAAPVAPMDSTPPLDTNSFYEGAFQSEGAHRILYTNVDEYKLVMVGFPDHHGYAFAASDLPAAGGGYVAAARADGYPNMEALTAFITHITSAVLKTKTGKDMMDATLNSVKGAGTDTKSPDAKIPDDKSTDDKGTDKK